jgi:hypothetical protein
MGKSWANSEHKKAVTESFLQAAVLVMTSPAVSYQLQNFHRTAEVFESFPQARQTPIRIELVYQHPPSDSAARFLSAAQRQLKTLGIVFSHSILPPGY